jgi:predicted transcriptional regulator
MQEIYQLKELRFKHNVSQWELARKTGLHQSRISLIEKGYIEPSQKEKSKIESFFKNLEDN